MHPQDTASSEGTRIPLYRKNGTIVAYALIDADDLPLVTGHTWRLDATGYASHQIRRQGQRYSFRLHRILLGLPLRSDGRQGDHINRDRLDNRRSNLRIVPHAGNMQNRSKHREVHSAPGGIRSQYRGVYWERRIGRWRAALRVNGQVIRLGCFTDEAAAGEAARLARERLMPFAVD